MREVRAINRLKEVRLARGIMQTEIAGRAGLSNAFVSDLEKNRRTAKPETWARIAEAIGCTVEEINPPADAEA